MKHKYPLLLAFVIRIVFLNAQATFQADYHNGTLGIPGNIIQNPAGNYIMAGTNATFIPIYGTVTEFDSLTHIHWANGYVASIATQINDIKNVTAGGYIAAGVSNPGLMLMRLNNTGSVTWANTYHYVGVNSSAQENASRVIPTSDGGFVVAGYIYQVDPDGAGPQPRYDSANLFCMKVDASGNLLWSHVIFVTNAFINHHVLQDVAEVSDGYIFTGYTSQVAGNQAPTYGLVMKTDFSGTLQWMKSWGTSGNSAEGNSAVALSGTQVLISGDDNSNGYYLNFNSGGTITTGNIYTPGGFIPVMTPYNAVPTSDGNYALIGSYIQPFAFSFTSFILKVNASTGSQIFGTTYTAGLSTILPEGRQVRDSGYVMMMTAQEFNGFNFHVVKTNAAGAMNGSACTAGAMTTSRSGYGPALSSIAPPYNLAGASTSSFSPAVLPVTFTDSIVCAVVVICNPPPAPTASASAPSICSGQSSTINASGGGSVFNVFANSTGGTSLGTTPWPVSPTGTTTYYVEATTSPGCVSAARTPVTVTVVPKPGPLGTITGDTIPCIGGQLYTVQAVAGTPTYTWSVTGGGVFTSAQGNVNITVTWTTPGGPYNLLVTAANTCGSSTATLAVNVIGAPVTPTASASPNPACVGDSVVLTGSATGATTWSWNGPNSYVSGVKNPVLHNIQNSQAGLYTLTASNNCGSVTAPVTVVINTAPTIVTAGASPNPVCQNSSVNLSGSATAATSWGWTGPNAYTSPLQNPTLAGIQPSQAGFYKVTATNSCGSTSDSVNVVVNTKPMAVSAVATPNPVCFDSLVQLTGGATGATSWSWAGPNSYTALTQNPGITNIQNNQAGLYTVTASNTCGSATATVTIAVNTVPTAVNPSADSTSICNRHLIGLHGSASGAISYSWTGPNGYISSKQNDSIMAATVADSGAYILTATNVCGSSMATININVDTAIRNVSATSSPGDTLCTGATITLQANGVNVNTWLWTGPGGYSSTAQTPIRLNATTLDSGQYVLTASNACGNVYDTLNILIELQALTLNTSSSVPSDSVCSGQTVSLFASGSAFTSYSWTGPAGFTSVLQNPVLANASTAQSGVYTVTGNVSCGNKSASITIQIDTVIQNLTVSSVPSDSVCTGSSFTLTASGTNVFTWFWTGPGPFSSNLQSPVITNATSLNSGAYVLTARNACGYVNAIVNIFVEDSSHALTASASTPRDSSCSGQSVNLFAGGGFFNSYSWTGPSGFTSSLQNPVLNNATTFQSGLYTVTGTKTCGSASSSVTIQIDTAIRSLSVTSTPNDTVCAGTPVSLNGSGTNVHSWLWSGPGGYTSSSQNATVANTTAANTGFYVLTAANACGTVSDSLYIIVETNNPSLTATSSAINDTACNGRSINLFANGTYDHYSWTGPNGFSSNQQNPSVPNATVASSGTYLLRAVNACGNNTASLVLNIDTIPLALQLSSTSSGNITCQGQNTTINATGTGVAAWSWTGPNGFTSVAASFTLSNIQPDQQGSYIVTARNACGFNEDTIRISVLALPDSLFVSASSDSICPGVSVTLNARQGLNNIVWNTGQSGTPVTTTQPGLYYYTAKDANNCAVTSDTFHIYLAHAIGAHVTANPDTVFVENASQLNVSTAVQTGLTYQWEPADSVKFNTISNPFVSPRQNTLYTVFVKDTISGCMESDSIEVYVLYNNLFAIPNVFTPNGDGLNDTWYVITEGGFVTVQEIKISDRWGDPVFDSQRDGTLAWNGHYHGKLQSMGNYVYTIKLKINATAEEKFIKGNLSLIW